MHVLSSGRIERQFVFTQKLYLFFFSYSKQGYANEKKLIVIDPFNALSWSDCGLCRATRVANSKYPTVFRFHHESSMLRDGVEEHEERRKMTNEQRGALR